MKRRPTLEDLQRRAGYPNALPSYLGCALASWLLPGSGSAVFPDAPGSVILLFRNGGGGSQDAPPIPGLGRGILLPVEWRPGDHSGWLPRGVLEVASRVRELVASSGESYGLHPSVVLGEVDLSGLDLRGGSIFVPLAAALRVLLLGGKGKPLVFSTGAWDPGRERVATVKGYEQKIGAIRGLLEHRNEKAMLFVPDDDLEEANRYAGDRIVISPLGVVGHREQKSAQDRLFEQIGPLLARFEAPPDRNADLDLRIAYVNRPYIKADREVSYRYQVSHLAEDLGKEAEFKGQASEKIRGAHLAMSFNPQNFSLGSILFHAVNPSRLLLLAFENKEDKKARKFAQDLGIQEEHLTLVSVVPEREETAIEKVAQFLGQHATAEHPGLVECTNGLSILKVVMTLAAARTGALILNLDLNKGTTFQVQRRPPIQVYPWASQCGVCPGPVRNPLPTAP